MPEVASSSIAIIPTFKGFKSGVDKEASGVGKSGGSAFRKGFDGATRSIAASALTKLKSDVNAAGRAYRAALDVQASAAGKVRVAEAQLNQLRSSGKASTAQLVAAEERLAAAQRSVASASEKTASANKVLSTSQRSLKDATAATATAGAAGASKYGAGWRTVGAKIKAALTGGVRDAAAKAEPVADRSGKQSGSRFAAGFGGALRGLVAPLAALAAGGAALGFIRGAIGEARESQKVGALTAQVIKSMGNQANITAGQVGDLATAISNKTGIDDEAIQSASNLLLTFGKVRNEVGKGNDIFNQATQIATDMGVALGKDPKAAAIQLGKALNDPLKGITALSRAGVSFTAQQKAQITQMVKSGDTLGAQKLILAELRKEFGGAAAAAANGGLRAQVAWGNFKEALGTAVLPLIDKIGGKVADALTAVTAQVAPFAKRLGTAFKGVATAVAPVAKQFKAVFNGKEAAGAVGPIGLVAVAVRGIADAVQAVAPAMKQFKAVFAGKEFAGAAGPIGEVATVIRGVVDQVGPILKQIGPLVTAAFAPLLPVIGQLGQAFATVGPQVSPLMIVLRAIAPVMPVIVAAVSQLAVAFSGLLTSALAAVLPILVQLGQLITTQIVPVLSQLITTLLPPLSAAFAALAPAVGSIIAALAPVISTLIGILVPVIAQLVQALLPAYSAILTAIGPIFTMLASVIAPLVTLLGSILIPIIQALLPVVTTVFGVIASIITAAMQVIMGIVQVVTGVLTGNWSQAWDGIKNIVFGVWNLIKAIVVGAVKIVGAVIVAAWNIIKGVTVAVWNAIKGAVLGSMTATAAVIAGKIAQARAAIINGWNIVKGGTVAAWNGIKSAVASALVGLMTTVLSIPGKIKGAFSAAGSWLSAAGRNIVDGLVSGITGSIGRAAEAAASMAKRAIDAAKSALKINSPSRVFRDLGRGVGEGFVLGVTGSARSVQAATTALANKIIKAFDARNDAIAKATGKARKALLASLPTPRNESRALAAISAASRRLVTIANQRAAATTKISAANKKLTDAVKIRDDFAKSVRDSVADEGNITGFGEDPQAIIDGMRRAAEATDTFASVLAKLRKAGLNSVSYRQLLAKGVDASGIAQSLLMGGSAAIRQVNDLESRLGKSATNLGNTAARDLYQAGVDSAKGLVAGLRSQEAALAAQARKIAKTLAATLKKELKIKSPSRLLRDEVGVQAGLGVVAGLDSTQQRVEAAGRRLAAKTVGAVTSNGGRLAAPQQQIFVQNPFTGEYLLAQVGQVADRRIGQTAAMAGVTF